MATTPADECNSTALPRFLFCDIAIKPSRYSTQLLVTCYLREIIHHYLKHSYGIYNYFPLSKTHIVSPPKPTYRVKYLPTCLSACLPTNLPTYISTYIRFNLPTCLSTCYLPTYPPWYYLLFDQLIDVITYTPPYLFNHVCSYLPTCHPT